MLIDKAYLFQKVCYILMSARKTDIKNARLSAKIHFWKNGISNSNLEIKVTWTFGMLSMNWDAFDGIRKKNSQRHIPTQIHYSELKFVF